MFCTHCGKQIRDDSAFCVYCGVPMGQAPQQPSSPNIPPVQTVQVPPVQTVQVRQTPANAAVANFLGALKNIFTKNRMRGLAHTTTDKTISGLLLFALFIFGLGFSVPTVLLELVSSIAKGAGKVYSEIIGFGPLLGCGLLVGCIIAVLITTFTFMLLKLIGVSSASFVSTMNMVSYSTLPVTIVLYLNMLLGLISFPLCIITLLGSIILQILMIYSGIQKFAKLERPPVVFYSVLVTIGMIAFSAIILFAYTMTFKYQIDKILDLIMYSLFPLKM